MHCPGAWGSDVTMSWDITSGLSLEKDDFLPWLYASVLPAVQAE